MLTARASRLLFGCLALALVAGCASLPERPRLAAVNSIAPAADAPLDLAVADAEARHPGAAGFRLLTLNTNALLSRVVLAEKAEQSIDVQTYIWHADATGFYLAQTLLQAADRGVRVRLLVDDLDARARNADFAALAAHPNIEVRMFNPFASRSGKMSLASEGVRHFGRINRRMHNKSWIADNRIALVGGRNLGNEYFTASHEVNFVDLDFAMIGPVVRDVSASFDRFWNSESAWPIELLDAGSVKEDALVQLRSKLAESTAGAGSSRYAQALRENDGIRRLVSGDWELRWSTNYQFVSDDPAKVTMEEKDAARAVVGAAVVKVLREAQTSLEVISPYFVPGDAGSQVLTGRAAAGADVRILTNSLAANDVATVHGGYSRKRKELLEGGVKLWELKRQGHDQVPDDPKKKTSSFAGSSGASLHTKALSADGRIVFVGSYNLDPRSTWLNCEQGVLVEDPVLAKQLAGIFEIQSGGSRAWHVTLEKGDLRWSDGTQTLDSEPGASGWRKFQAWFARAFHMDAQL